MSSGVRNVDFFLLNRCEVCDSERDGERGRVRRDDARG